MLRFLELKDFALFSSLELELGPGLSAFTGETGAGKSILVDALMQLSGNRADSGLIRSGTNAALIQGEFRDGRNTTTLARRLQANGRSTARIDAELVTVAELTERSRTMLAVHGQHAAFELTGAGNHLRMLDRMLGAAGLEARERVRRLHAEKQETAERLAELTRSEQERARRLDSLTWQLDEIEAAELTEGEEETLRARLKELHNADAVADGAALAFDLLIDREDAAADLLVQAQRNLAAAARYSSALEPLAGELAEAAAAVQATGAEVEDFLSGLVNEPGELERIQGRLALIEGLQRKYGSDIAEILEFAAGLAAEQEQLSLADSLISESEDRLQELEAELAATCRILSRERSAVAGQLEARMGGYLSELGMEAARFEVAFSQLETPAAHGAENGRFLFSANPGEPLRDLNQVASGGELSRLLLALNLVTGSDQPVLVFDEVDAGTGGRAAIAIGQLLRRLAEGRQVLVVTHLPQVAAFAARQYHVEKLPAGGRTLTQVRELDAEGRRAELARMLSGQVTEASLHAADELLGSAAA